MVAFELDHMLALLRRLDDTGHDPGVQERWQAYSECIRNGDARWLAVQLEALTAHLRRTTRIALGPFSPTLAAGRLRQIFWLVIWLYRTATRRRVDLPELVFALRDVALFVSALSGEEEGGERTLRRNGLEAAAAAAGASMVDARRARWEALARELWASHPELEGNASATARAIVARLRDEGDPNPGSVSTVRRFVARELRGRTGRPAAGVEG